MKILFTVNTYFPCKDGVQNVTQNLAEGLANRGNDVTVFTPSWGHHLSEETHNGVYIRRFEIKSYNGIYFGQKKEYIRAVVHEANQSDVMVNVALQCVATDILLAHLSKIRCKKVLYMHGMWAFGWSKSDFFPPQRILYKLWANFRWYLLYTFGFRRIRCYDIVTQLYAFDPTYQYFKKKGVRHQEIVGNAVEDSFFDESLITSEFPVEFMNIGEYVLFVGNFCDRKNQKFLLESFYLTCSKNLSLVLIGSEKNRYYHQLRQYNEELSKRFGYARKVFFLTEVSRDAIALLTAHARMYVMSSRKEVQPVSILEAMSCGVPFISTDVGCVRYLPGGVIVDTPEEMTYWIDLFAADVELSSVVGLGGKKYAMKYCRCQLNVVQFERILKSMVE